jgi:hypothetical protein
LITVALHAMYDTVHRALINRYCTLVKRNEDSALYDGRLSL